MIVTDAAAAALDARELSAVLRALWRGKSPGSYFASVLMVNLGLRVGEAVQVRVEDVSPNGRSLKSITLKRRVPTMHRHDIPAALAPVIVRARKRAGRAGSPWLIFDPKKPSRPLTARSIQRAVNRAAKRAGITKRVTPHVFRHSRAMLVYNAGLDRSLVTHDLRHADPRSADQYVAADEKRYREVTLGIPSFY